MYIPGSFSTGRGLAHAAAASGGALAWISRLICALLTFAAPLPAAGAGAAAVVSKDHSTVRLFAAAVPGSDWSAGLEIVLAEGWKTYWRIPGEAGVPPVFDWTGSRNLADVVVGWPAPHRLSDASGETIGYKDRVVFPLRVRSVAKGSPVTLDLKLFYAACNDICVPAEAHLAIDIEPDAAAGGIADVALIEKFAGQLPAEPAPGTRPSIRRLSVEQGGEGVRLVVSLEGELDAAATDMFVEGFDGAYFRKPRPRDDGPRASEFLLPIDGLKEPAELRGQTLAVTLVSGAFRLAQRLPVN